MDISSDPLLQEFFESRKQKPKTVERYLYVFNLFYESTGHTPTSMIEEAEDDEDNNVRLRRRKINQHLKDFKEDQEKQEFSYDSITSNTSYIRAFYKHYGIVLPARPKLDKPDEKVNLPQLEDIQLAVSQSNPCFQAIIILMCSSGMGLSEIINLTIQDFLDAFNEKNDPKIDINDLPHIGEMVQIDDEKQIKPLVWQIKRVKTSKSYFTFSSCESYQYILRYFRSKPKVEDPDRPLFLNQSRRKMRPHGFNQYFRDLNKRCGWGKSGRQIFFRSHNLRKWFANQLENTSLGFINTERLLAHSILGDTASRYFKPDLNKMYKLYYDNMDMVTVMGKVDIHDTTDERLLAMEEENRKMKEDLEHFKKIIMDKEKQEKLP
jgi:integrase